MKQETERHSAGRRSEEVKIFNSQGYAAGRRSKVVVEVFYVASHTVKRRVKHKKGVPAVRESKEVKAFYTENVKS